MNIVKLNGTINLDNFKITFVTLTHSILEPNGLKIDTPAGTIFHTGDWKVDPNPLVGSKVNEEKLKIDHVGMWLGNNKFIQSSKNVRISSVSPNDKDYDSYHMEKYIMTKRIINSSE